MIKGFKAIGSIISYFDFLGHSPKIKVYSKSCYKTTIGGLLSFTIAMLTLIGISYFGKELFLKENPIAIESIKEYDKVGPFNLNNKEFEIYAAVEYANYTYFNDPRIFEFTAFEDKILVDEKGVQSYHSKNLEIVNCENYYSSEELDNQIDTKLFYCLKPNSTHIEGYWGNTINQYVRIKLSKCTNTTQNNNHCFSDDIIDSTISGGILSMFIKNSMLQLKDYDKPVKYTNENQYYSLNIDFTFTLFIDLKPLVIENDRGYLLQNLEEIKGFVFETPKLLYFRKRGRLLADITLQSKHVGKIISRHYLKIQDILTSIGGLIKAFMIIGSVIGSICSEIEFYIDFIFNVSLNQERVQGKISIEDKSKQKLSTSNFELKNKTIQKELRASVQNYMPKKLELKIISIQESNKQYKLCNIIKDYYSFIVGYFSKVKPKSLILKKLFDESLSIENIFNKMGKVEKLYDKIMNEKEKEEHIVEQFQRFK